MQEVKYALITELNGEYRNIQLALKDAGYFAYKVAMRPLPNQAPELEIHARAWCDGDDELLNR
jgi:hypothetical protein